MAIARYVDVFGGLRAGDTFLRQVDGNRRIRRVVSLTDQGWVEVEQLTIDGKSFNVDSVKRWLSPEEAQLYLRAEGQAVNTAFKPGMSLEFPKAPFGTATVLEDRGAQVLVTYMGNANGSLARLEVEVPRDDVRPMIQEKDGVGVGRTYFHRTTTKSAEVKEIYPSGDVKYLELDSVQSGINYRTATLDSFQRAYLVRVDDVPATNAAEHPQP
jgi:hypothetical protein